MSQRPLTRTETYLARLPSGLDSYPHYLVKAAPLRHFLETLHFGTEVQSLPSTLRTLVESPLPMSSWMPEVHAVAFMLAVRDLLFHDDDSVYDSVLRSNRELFSGPLYKALFFFIKPEKMFQYAESRWASMHKGIRLTLQSSSSQAATFRVDFPPHLIEVLVARCLQSGFVVALEAAGGKDVHFWISELRQDHAIFRGSWH
jgi:hypothetical protein